MEDSEEILNKLIAFNDMTGIDSTNLLYRYVSDEKEINKELLKIMAKFLSKNKEKMQKIQKKMDSIEIDIKSSNMHDITNFCPQMFYSIKQKLRVKNPGSGMYYDGNMYYFYEKFFEKLKGLGVKFGVNKSVHSLMMELTHTHQEYWEYVFNVPLEGRKKKFEEMEKKFLIVRDKDIDSQYYWYKKYILLSIEEYFEFIKPFVEGTKDLLRIFIEKRERIENDYALEEISEMIEAMKEKVSVPKFLEDILPEIEKYRQANPSIKKSRI